MPERATTILVVGPIPPPVHGAGRVTQSVIGELRARLEDEAVATLTVVSTSAHGAGVGYHAGRITAHLRAARELVVARRRGAVVLYLGGAGGAGLWYQAALVALARLLAAKTVFHHHTCDYVLGPRRLAMRTIVATMGDGDAHVCLSPSMSEGFARRYVPRGRLLLVSNARFVRDEPPMRPVGGRSRLRLVHISNLSVEKGTLRVVAAFEQLRARGVDVSLTLVGSAGDDAVRGAIDAAGTRHPDTFRHHGPAEQDQVYRVLDESSLFVFPTAYRLEAQPLVVLEALARGVPVLASARGAIPDVLPEPSLIDEAAPLDAQIERFVDEEPGMLAARARALFEASRDDGVDLVDELLELAVGVR